MQQRRYDVSLGLHFDDAYWLPNHYDDGSEDRSAPLHFHCNSVSLDDKIGAIPKELTSYYRSVREFLDWDLEELDCSQRTVSRRELAQIDLMMDYEVEMDGQRRLVD